MWRGVVWCGVVWYGVEWRAVACGRAVQDTETAITVDSSVLRGGCDGAVQQMRYLRSVQLMSQLVNKSQVGHLLKRLELMNLYSKYDSK